MVEATDELRRQIAEVIADYHGRMIQAHTLFSSYELAGELLPLVVAVVAEARTEALLEAADIAENRIHPNDPHCEVCRIVGALRAVALRGVGNQKVGVTVDDLALDEMDGNQNAEPRWSANRLEEVLREGLPDQNAEPLDLDVCECGKHSLTVIDHAAWLQFVAWADQKGTEQ